MATHPQEKQVFTNNTNYTTPRPIKEEYEREGGTHDIDDESSCATGCGCFRLFRFHQMRSNDGETNSLLQQKGGDSHDQNKGPRGNIKWVEDTAKSVKEFSEVVAGPKWKNFIRRLGKIFNKKKKRTTHFQYDPYSYALNFDDGVEEREEDEGYFLNGYSSRL